MASIDSRTNDWVLELNSLDSLDDPASPATHNFDDARLPRWSTELTPGDGLGEPRARSTTRRPSSPLPGAAECLDFVKTRSGRLRPARETRLRNNLLAAVGFLEFGNAGDFAANVCKFPTRLERGRAPTSLALAAASSRSRFFFWFS